MQGVAWGAVALVAANVVYPLRGRVVELLGLDYDVFKNKHGEEVQQLLLDKKCQIHEMEDVKDVVVDPSAAFVPCNRVVSLPDWSRVHLRGCVHSIGVVDERVYYNVILRDHAASAIVLRAMPDMVGVQFEVHACVELFNVIVNTQLRRIVVRNPAVVVFIRTAMPESAPGRVQPVQWPAHHCKCHGWFHRDRMGSCVLWICFLKTFFCWGIRYLIETLEGIQILASLCDFDLLPLVSVWGW